LRLKEGCGVFYVAYIGFCLWENSICELAPE
jgi:hypothetical protein